MNAPPLILIAADDPVSLHALQTHLTAWGYQVLLATDGEQAVALARSAGPDLILLDLAMPKLDGRAVCRRLRADGSLPFTPIVLVTAAPDPADIDRGLAAGADEYLMKPVDPMALRTRVRAMLRTKELHDAVEELSKGR